MSTSAEQKLEAEIQAKGLTSAPRVTPAALDSMIKDTALIKIDDVGMLCVLTLHNGLKIVGKNLGPVCPENYNEDLAKQLAHRDARDQLWPLAGFMLAEDIHRGNRPLTQEQRELPDHVQRVLTEMYQYASRLQGITDFFDQVDSGALDTAEYSAEELVDLRQCGVLLAKLVNVTQGRLNRAGV
jgi:hypothetical protein